MTKPKRKSPLDPLRERMLLRDDMHRRICLIVQEEGLTIREALGLLQCVQLEIFVKSRERSLAAQKAKVEEWRCERCGQFRDTYHKCHEAAYSAGKGKP